MVLCVSLIFAAQSDKLPQKLQKRRMPRNQDGFGGLETHVGETNALWTMFQFLHIQCFNFFM